jgi:hypothetical protein
LRLTHPAAILAERWADVRPFQDAYAAALAMARRRFGLRLLARRIPPSLAAARILIKDSAEIGKHQR